MIARILVTFYATKTEGDSLSDMYIYCFFFAVGSNIIKVKESILSVGNNQVQNYSHIVLGIVLTQRQLRHFINASEIRVSNDVNSLLYCFWCQTSLPRALPG